MALYALKSSRVSGETALISPRLKEWILKMAEVECPDERLVLCKGGFSRLRGSVGSGCDKFTVIK